MVRDFWDTCILNFPYTSMELQYVMCIDKIKTCNIIAKSSKHEV